MALNIKDPETDQLARRLSTLTGESITMAVKTAVRERIERDERTRGKASIEELMTIAKRIASRIDRDGARPKRSSAATNAAASLNVDARIKSGHDEAKQVNAPVH